MASKRRKPPRKGTRRTTTPRTGPKFAGYRVELKPSAAKSLAALAKDDQRRIARRIDELARDPRNPGVEKIKGAQDLYRVRAGDYRILYTICDAVLVVLVIQIGHRREVYRGG